VILLIVCEVENEELAGELFVAVKTRLYPLARWHNLNHTGGILEMNYIVYEQDVDDALSLARSLLDEFGFPRAYIGLQENPPLAGG